ncbi:MAG: ubiquinol-cytochrome c reductase cytochrome b subunit [Gaiellales bacterium]|nr:ubiquinol-cytochrome c reductase cytochrome b subunit [Gaiellales bacterium]
MIRGLVRALDTRTGIGRPLVAALRYVFPDHWSFLLGEIALYAFVVLLGTGVYLTFFFEPSYAETVYRGSYEPLRGHQMTEAYRSSLDLTFEVRAGLLMRQTHHWAALVFIAAIVVHLMRIFFTGAFRRPRDMNYVIGLTMLILAILEGYAGYSLPDDLVSGMGLAVGYAVALSVPIIGEGIVDLIWGGQFPGTDAFASRLYIAHVLLFPAIIATLLAIHMALIVAVRHTQFPGPGRRERNVVGSPMWPSYAFRSLGLMFAVAAVLFLLGGLVQINPLWHYGPYEPSIGTNGVQPDWYMGWMIGALRLMPPFEPEVFGYTLPNVFLPGVVFPLVVFAVLYSWPWLERWMTADREPHHLLQRPRDVPWRTAFGAGFFTWVAVPFLAGASDRIFVTFDIPYESQVDVLRLVWFIAPPIVFLLTLWTCRRLRETNIHPLRGWVGSEVHRTPEGGFEVRRPRR